MQGQKAAERCRQNLQNNGFGAHFLETAESARELLLQNVSKYNTFGFTGSATVRALGIMVALKAEGKVVYDR